MKINELSTTDQRGVLLQCCTSNAWVDLMLVKFPFKDEAALLECADESWKRLKETDYLEAFSGHPKIGDVKSLQEKFSSTSSLASREQSSVESADDETLKMLAVGNKSYELKFGFIFIVCATGKSAEQMLELLQTRMVNDRETELVNAAEQQRQIFHIRIKQLP
ncbi:MAG: 2-oxo-4-hydroxy-4-carboxy-5-ureidoimidazoline decarboxylase [Pseudomonadales bacterium]|nr:2-oxo-4-hydroxy-4-carboxy-5-ureidoimidazoline decarboxylase [Pseudomonadales bacterium]